MQCSIEHDQYMQREKCASNRDKQVLIIETSIIINFQMIIDS